MQYRLVNNNTPGDTDMTAVNPFASLNAAPIEALVVCVVVVVLVALLSWFNSH